MTLKEAKRIIIGNILRDDKESSFFGWQFGSDIFGKFLFFRHPGTGVNKYYLNIDVIANRQEKVEFSDNIVFTIIGNSEENTNSRKSLLYYNGKYYITTGVSITSREPWYRGILFTFDEKKDGQNVRAKATNEYQFDKIFNNLDKKEINI